MHPLLDRQEHLSKLKEQFDAQFPATRLVLATGGSGVGKTMVLEAASRSALTWKYVLADAQKIDDYLPSKLYAKLQTAIDAAALEHGLVCFEDYLAQHVRQHTLGKIGRIGAAFISKTALGSAGAQALADAYELAKPSDTRAQLAALADDADAAKVFYVLDVLQADRLIIHIDHCDELDRFDYELLDSLLSLTDSLFVLEFTAASAGDIPALKTPLRRHRPLIMEVGPLPIEFADRLFDAAPLHLIPSLREQFLASGSLRPFDETQRYRAQPGSEFELFDASDASFKRRMELEFRALDDGAQKLLLAVAAHAGPVDREVLLTFLDSDATQQRFALPKDHQTELELLEHRLLLIGTDRTVSVHERVVDLIQRDATLPTVILAFQQLWRDLYYDTSLFISDNERYRQLLFYSTKLDDLVGIAEALEAIGRRGIAARNPRSVAGFVRLLVRQMDFGSSGRASEDLAKITLEQARFFYEAGWLDEAIGCLSLITEQPLRYRYLLAELYCGTLYQKRGLRLVERFQADLRRTRPADIDAELCLQLVRLHGLRNANRLEEARSIYVRLTSEPNYRSRRAYPTLLRYADLCLWRDEDIEPCIQHLELAVKLARAAGIRRELAASAVTLAQQYGYYGRFSEANDLLSEAAETADAVWLEQYTILNNRALIDLYGSRVGSWTVFESSSS